MEISALRDLVLNEFSASEHDHFGKPAYRAAPKKSGGKPGKIFMTLWIEEGHAVLMLTKDQQVDLIDAHPDAFEPHPSKWGEKGATIMHVLRLDRNVVQQAITIAHGNSH